MLAILEEIRSGRFAEEWLAACKAGKGRLRQLAAAELAHPSEAAGRSARAMAQKGVGIE